MVLRRSPPTSEPQILIPALLAPTSLLHGTQHLWWSSTDTFPFSALQAFLSPTIWVTPLLTLKAGLGLCRETLQWLTQPVGEPVARRACLRLGQGQNCHLTTHSALTYSPVLPCPLRTRAHRPATYITSSSRLRTPPAPCQDGWLHS